MAVHICPVCKGRATMPCEFYDPDTTESGRVPCRACGGKGVIITPERSIYPPYKPPLPCPFPLPSPYDWWGRRYPYDNPWWRCGSDGTTNQEWDLVCY